MKDNKINFTNMGKTASGKSMFINSYISKEAASTIRNIRCSGCGNTTIMENTYVIKDEPAVMEFKGESFEILKSSRICSTCKSPVFDNELSTENTRKLSAAYAEKHGFTMNDINVKSLREFYGLKQTTFAKVLGIGLTSIKRYESGRVMPNNSQATIFKKLMNANKSIQEFYELNQDNLSTDEKEELEGRIIELFGDNDEGGIEASNPSFFTNFNDLFMSKDTNNVVSSLIKEIMKSNKTGAADRIEFDLYKILTLIKWYTSKSQTWTDIKNFLFLTDLVSYKKTGRLLTGLIYLKSKNDLQIKNFDLLLTLFETSQYIKREVEEYENGLIQIRFVSLQICNPYIFVNKERKIINRLIFTLTSQMDSLDIKMMVRELAQSLLEKEGSVIDFKHLGNLPFIIEV